MFFPGLSSRQRNRCSLASAFIGEIAAVMDAVQKHSDLRRAEEAGCNGSWIPSRLPDLQLPKFSVYEANAGQLGLFNAPLSRELSYFYTRLATLPGHLQALKSLSPSTRNENKSQNQEVLDDIEDTMQLGENLLRDIRAFVSHKSPSSISRA